MTVDQSILYSRRVLNKHVLPTFLHFFVPGGIVDQGVLQERAEHEEDAHPAPHIDGLGVGHRGQRVLDARLIIK